MIRHKDLNTHFEHRIGFKVVIHQHRSVFGSVSLANAYEACYRFRKSSQNSRLGNLGFFRAGGFYVSCTLKNLSQRESVYKYKSNPLVMDSE